MLQTLLKILLFLGVTLGLALLAIRLGETGESLQIIVAGRSYELGAVEVVIAVLGLMGLGWAVLRLVGVLVAVVNFLLGDETALNRYFARSRARKGYEALGEGMLALASGEGRQALTQAEKAERFLDQPHLANVLKAQAAGISGDSRAAEAAYRAMLPDPRTRFVAIRGLMQQRLAAGDTETALALAQKAYALKPEHSELQDTLLGLSARAGDWKGARAVVRNKRSQGKIPADVAIRRDAVLALQEAREVLAEGVSISAREAAISANKASPDLIPAAVLAARSYLARDDRRNATRVLNKTWAMRPHPSIAAAYAEIVPDETPAQRLTRFADLIRQNPTHPESHLLEAELMLAAEDFPGARRALGDLAVTDPTVRSLSIMAAIERGAGADDSVVRGWLARALTASRGPQWVCDNCHHVMADWAPICDSCDGFDTLSWTVPEDKPGESAAQAAAAAMLPLLVGRPAEAAEPAGEVTIDAAPDAPAQPAAATRPGHVETGDDYAAPRPRAEKPPEAPQDLPNVAPGMVPRESDYPQPVPRPRVVLDGAEDAEHAPPRPDVEPPEADTTPAR